jgi:3-dehydroquinate synthase
MNARIHVRLPARSDRSYDVLIRPGALQGLPGILAKRHRGAALFVVTDTNVGRLYGREVHHHLESAGLSAVLVDVPAGERSKSVECYHELAGVLLRSGIRRNSVVVGLGGGVVGDLAGFVAATVLRGVEYVQVPTSLLAQVDSSVGGKTGIDHAMGKNLIGAFHQPSLVVIDPEVLRTLPPAEFRNGLAEVVKIAAALDARFFRTLERCAHALTRTDTPLLTRIIRTAVGLKAGVVQRDEREAGLRKALNLGHTIGHAVESASGYRLRHGEAVAIGLILEGRLAVTCGVLSVNDHLRLLRLLEAFGLPTRLPRFVDRKEVLAGLAADKKNRSAVPLFVLPKKIGMSAIGVTLPADVIRAGIV